MLCFPCVNLQMFINCDFLTCRAGIMLVWYYIFDIYSVFLIVELLKEQFKCNIHSSFLKYINKQAASIS
jgi:hypothetical protein